MDQPQPPIDQSQQPPPPTLSNPRFTLELEFVSSLANPYYLSHLAVTYPYLLGISNAGDEGDAAKDTADPDAQAFAAYLAYLYSYWKTPEYAQFLTHPGATLRALRLLQEDTFRRDIIRPQVIEELAGTGINNGAGGVATEQDGEQDKEDQGKPEDAGNNNTSKT
ncbi:SOH1-domain-containing protein [Aspergillus coremiiformis]|uniref:Mediator of RNA polymerase II transcription subunit 31 n=1 Tax=Aspergillus coremiiformis TaxID=138285 RepID=A0A5N6Z226_9EURO|nr:SOH1-domain-containing protein [Aspergillus coremiiformis]